MRGSISTSNNVLFTHMSILLNDDVFDNFPRIDQDDQRRFEDVSIIYQEIDV